MAMQFESHELPDDGDLVPLLRRVSKQGFVERGDLGDFSPFDWVNRLYKVAPEWRDRIDDAYATLLTAEDPLPQLVLEQIGRIPVRSFLPRLFKVIAGRCAELAARPDTLRTNGRSLLGSIVHEAATMPKSAPPPIEVARELAAITRPEDGWPLSFRLALPGDIAGQLPRVLGILQRFSDDELKSFVAGMLADGPPWTDIVFGEIARGPTDLRDRVAKLVHDETEEMEISRRVLAKMQLDDAADQAIVRAAVQRPNPWPEYAKALGVDGSN